MTDKKRKKRSWENKFLALLAKTGNVSESCRVVGVSRKVAYQLRDEAADFAQAWKEAQDEAGDALEREAWRRGVEGVEEPVGWYQGMAGGTVRRYSDTLLIVLLKGNRPEKYRDNVDITSGGQPVAAVAYITENRPKDNDPND